MKFRALIHYLNDEEAVGMWYTTFDQAHQDLLKMRERLEDHDDSDVQFFQIDVDLEAGED